MGLLPSSALQKSSTCALLFYNARTRERVPASREHQCSVHTIAGVQGALDGGRRHASAMSGGAGSIEKATFSVASGVLLAEPGPAPAAGALREASAPLPPGNCRRYAKGLWPFAGGKCRTCGEPQTGRGGASPGSACAGGARTRACECGPELGRLLTTAQRAPAACHAIPHVCQVCGLSFTALTNTSTACKVHPLNTIVVSASPQLCCAGPSLLLRVRVPFAWSHARLAHSAPPPCTYPCRWLGQKRMPRTNTPPSSGNAVQTSRRRA